MTPKHAVPGFPLYSVTTEGQVWSHRKSRWMACKSYGAGYPMVILVRDGKHYPRTVHRIVWETFRGPIPAGLEINHLNGVRHDNRLENLEVCTPSENIAHSYRCLGRKASYQAANMARAKLSAADVHCIRDIYARGGVTHRQIAKEYGVAYSLITRIIARKSWRQV